MLYFLYALFILSCLVLVATVLLQPGKADAGALFTSSVSSTTFGPRGTQTLLAKITVGAAVVFMFTALALSLPYFTGARSVLQSADEDPAPAATAAPSATPASTPAATPQAESSPAAATPQPAASPSGQEKK